MAKKSDSESIRNAIQELAHHDPAARLKALEFLVDCGATAQPFLKDALADPKTLDANYHQEIVRAQGWIKFGDDPDKLYELIQRLDPRRLSHGNMFGGALGAIESAPTFQQFIQIGGKIHAFLEEVIASAELSYSLRTAAVVVLDKVGTAKVVPILTDALEREHEPLKTPELQPVRIDDTYQGVFIFALNHTLARLTGEFFPFGIVQSLSGGTSTIYEPTTSERNIQRWRDWWSKTQEHVADGDGPRQPDASEPSIDGLLIELANSTNCDESYARYALNRLGPEGDARVVNFVLGCDQGDVAAVALVEMLIQNGRGTSLPEGQRTAQAIADWLAGLENALLLRAAINRSYAALPASTFRAIAIAFPQHQLSGSPHLFNPFVMVAMDSFEQRSEQLSIEGLNEIISGMTVDDQSTQSLFLDIASSSANLLAIKGKQKPEAEQLQKVFRERLLEIRNAFSRYDHRVAVLEILELLGQPAELEQLLEILRAAGPEASLDSVATLVETIPRREIPETMRDSVAEMFFALAKSHPPLHQTIFSALAKVLPKHFDYSPAIGPQGLLALIEIYRLTTGSAGELNQTTLREPLRILVAEIGGYAKKSKTFERVIAVNALKTCTRLARQFRMGEELFEALGLQANILTNTEVIDYGEWEGIQAEAQLADVNESEYFQSVKTGTGPTSYDLGALLFEEAARVAVEHALPREKFLVARLSAADLARKAKRYECAEKIYSELEIKDSDNLYFVGHQKNHLTELFLDQGRWADALDVALELRALFSPLKTLTPPQSHFLLDTYLHELICCCRFENFQQAAGLWEKLQTGYLEMRHLEHYAEVLIELSVTYGKLGRHQDADEMFAYVQEFFEPKMRGHPVLAKALVREAAYRVNTGKAELATNLLEQANLRFEVLPRLENQPYERFAESFWLLGQAYLSTGAIQGAHECLSRLAGGKESPLLTMYEARLRAKIEASFGSTTAAIITLQECAQLTHGRIHRDLQVEMLLDLSDLLLREGFHERAQDVLQRGHQIAVEARNVHMAGRVRMMQARLFENIEDFDAARTIYQEILNSDETTLTADLVNAASLALVFMLASKEGNINLVDDVEGFGKSLSRIQDQALRINLLTRLAQLYLSNDRLDKASSILEIIEQEIRNGIPLNVSLEFKMLRGREARLNQRFEEAVSNFREAVHILEVAHASVLERGLGAGLFVSKDAPYRALVQSLVKTGKFAEALHYVERAKTRLFLDQIHWRVIKTQDESSALGRYLQILRRLAFLELESAGANEPAAAEERRALEDELGTLRKNLPEKELIDAVHPALGGPEQMILELRQNIGPESAVNRPPDFSTSDTDTSSRVILAEYFITDEELLLFVMRHDFTEPEVVIIDRTLSEIREFIKLNLQVEIGNDGRVLRSTGDKFRRLDEDSFNEFFAPLVAPLFANSESGGSRSNEGDQLWLVPYDVLHSVPLHAVKVDGCHLIARNPVSYAHSASLMKYCRQKQDATARAALVVGDSLEDLPHAREEALAVAQSLDTTPYLGRAATKVSIKEILQRERENLGTLHFSCHGYFDSAEALKSGIKLAPEPAENGGVLGKAPSNLTAEDIFDLELSAGLVILSACESGISEQRRGDELVGLTRALIHAGIPSLVVSLWNVNDISTGLLMQAFYRRLRSPVGNEAGGVTKAEALQAAQTYILNLTVNEVIEHCEQRLGQLKSPADFRSAVRYRIDKANLRIFAGDLRSAIADFHEVRKELDGNAESWAVQLIDQIDRQLPVIAIKAEEDPPKVDFTARPYQRLYYWAPFVLVGNWK